MQPRIRYKNRCFLILRNMHRNEHFHTLLALISDFQQTELSVLKLLLGVPGLSGVGVTRWCVNPSVCICMRD